MALTTSIPKGSWVLVTGANGYIAAYVVQEFLRQGYKVRGTVRSLTKSAWLVKEAFSAEASNGTFEIVAVEDMAKEDAFKEAVRGVAVVVHVASILTLEYDPNKVIPGTIAGVVNLLRTTAQEPSVKQFVYTSSVSAAITPVAETVFHVDPNTWNDETVKDAWAPPPYEPSRAFPVYMASKTEAEKALWKFVEEEKPSFTTNAVLPSTTYGPLLHERQNFSSGAWPLSLYNGELDKLFPLPAFVHVDVRDVASLHVAAALDPSVENARLHGWATPANFNDLLAIFRRAYPNKKFVEKVEKQGKWLGTIDNSLEEGLLRQWGTQPGWISLEASIRETVEGIQAKTD